MIRILVVDDHPVVRHGIRQMLEDEEEIEIIDEASSGKEMLEKMESQEYDVILLDISLPDRGGMDLIRQVKKKMINASVLIFSIHSEEIFALTALKEGASGFVTKSTPPDEVITAIKKVARGGKYISQNLAVRLADEAIANHHINQVVKLSVRESEVLDRFANGRSVTEIAKDLSLSPKTISTYRERLLKKLHLSNTAELIKFAIMRGQMGND